MNANVPCKHPKVCGVMSHKANSQALRDCGRQGAGGQRESAAVSVSALAGIDPMAALAEDAPKPKRKSRSKKRGKKGPSGRELRDEALKEAADAIIADLDKAIESGDIKQWQPLWRKVGRPVNAATGNTYQGSNYMFLSMQGGGMFATYKQWESLGFQVQKGAKHSKTFQPRPFTYEEEDEFGNKEERKAMSWSTNRVFPASMVEPMEGTTTTIADLEAKHGLELQQHEKIERAEQILNAEKLGVPVRDSARGRAVYSPATDSIEMPRMEAFESPEAYYSVLGHENIHATGHESRLGREGITDRSVRFGDETYAREELVAELGSAMLCKEIGIEQDTRDDHFAYLANWKKIIEDDPKVLSKIASQASEAVKHVLGKQPASTPEQAAV